ncbi:MAG TPA: SAM-dependent methyltransferase [Candidatus Angelobacter sp.]
MAQTTKIATAGEPLIRNISDTALWVAVYRARETERADALFHDPYARRLSGERGEAIAKSMEFGERNAWSYVSRTLRIDQIVTAQVQEGADMVIDLAAGLDARPYRMELPPSLQWIEVDLPAMIDYKEEILRDEKPRCSLERIRLDLSNAAARRDLFRELGAKAKKVLVITEGLLIYLSREEVLELGHDLAAQPSFCDWIVELTSPGLLKMLQKSLQAVERAGSPFKFAPREGPDFFRACGWKPVEVYSLLKTAAIRKRLPWMGRLAARLPESSGRQGSRPWGAICRVTRM